MENQRDIRDRKINGQLLLKILAILIVIKVAYQINQIKNEKNV